MATYARPVEKILPFACHIKKASLHLGNRHSEIVPFRLSLKALRSAELNYLRGSITEGHWSRRVEILSWLSERTPQTEGTLQVPASLCLKMGPHICSRICMSIVDDCATINCLEVLEVASIPHSRNGALVLFCSLTLMTERRCMFAARQAPYSYFAPFLPQVAYCSLSMY